MTEKIIAKALNNPFLSTLVMDETRYVILRSAQASFYLNVTAGEFVQILRNERKPPPSWKVGDIKKSELPTRVAKAMRKTAGEELIKISWGDDMSVINQVSVYFSLDEIFEGLKN